MRIIVAFRAFFATLFKAGVAQRVEAALEGPEAAPATAAPPTAAKKPAKPQPAKPARSEAITLLATLQREARFLDFVMEPLDDYADEQIGAAARDVHAGCAAAIKRLFDPRPTLAEEEGAAVEVPPGFDPARYRLLGNVAGEPPFRGQLAHHGWEAGKVELPQWTGAESSRRVVAPAEVELK